MKDIITKNIAASIIIVILLFIIGGLLLDKRAPSSNTQNAVPTPQTIVTQDTSSAKTQNTKPAVVFSSKTSIPMTQSLTGNYQLYAKQLAENQKICSDLAAKQYEAIYRDVLNSSSFSYNYVPTNGQCYSQVTGQIPTPYSTTTVSHLYFRNVLKNIVLAECSNPKGSIFSDSDAICTDKVTGQTIIKAKYNDLIVSYLSK